MHLLVLSRFPDGKAYGAETSLFNVCQELARRGHWITLLYNREGDLLPKYREFCFDVIPLKALSVYGRKEMLFSLPGLVRAALALPRAPYDLVYANQYPYLWAGLVISRLKGVPLVCHHRDGIPPGAMSPIWPWLFKRTAVNIFVSEATRDGWVNAGVVPAQTSLVVHNGIPTELFSPAGDFVALRRRMGVPMDEKVILYAGRLIKRKGIETLIEAFAEMLRRGRRASLWLVGGPEDPSYMTTLRSKCAELGVAARVRFLGHQKNVAPYYQISDEVVLPSVEDESFGKTVAESMACGTPVVASRIGGIPEVLSGPFKRFLFAPGDPRELSARLGETLDWRLKEPSLAWRCRQHVVSNFSIQNTLDGIEQAFQRAVA